MLTSQVGQISYKYICISSLCTWYLFKQNLFQMKHTQVGCFFHMKFVYFWLISWHKLFILGIFSLTIWNQCFSKRNLFFRWICFLYRMMLFFHLPFYAKKNGISYENTSGKFNIILNLYIYTHLEKRLTYI